MYENNDVRVVWDNHNLSCTEQDGKVINVPSFFDVVDINGDFAPCDGYFHWTGDNVSQVDFISKKGETLVSYYFEYSDYANPYAKIPWNFISFPLLENCEPHYVGLALNSKNLPSKITEDYTYGNDMVYYLSNVKTVNGRVSQYTTGPACWYRTQKDDGSWVFEKTVFVTYYFE